MLLMRACEKCHGSLLVEEEGRLKDLVCLQCGFRPKDGAERADRLIRARKAIRAGRLTWPAAAAG
jgi:hypothetical protein